MMHAGKSVTAINITNMEKALKKWQVHTERRTAVSAPCGSLKVIYATCDRSLSLKAKRESSNKPRVESVQKIPEHHYTGITTWIRRHEK